MQSEHATSTQVVTTIKAQYQLMAEYNRWMNERIYAACAALSDNELRDDLGAYFGSILGTLNHGLVGDTIWLQRFASHEREFSTLKDMRDQQPITQLDKRLHNEFSTLLRARTDLDLVIISLCREFDETDFDKILRYNNTQGRSFRRQFGLLVQHFFNHQTHHRGQITTLLSQRGIDVGVTDLLAIIPTH